MCYYTDMIKQRRYDKSEVIIAHRSIYSYSISVPTVVHRFQRNPSCGVIGICMGHVTKFEHQSTRWRKSTGTSVQGAMFDRAICLDLQRVHNVSTYTRNAATSVSFLRALVQWMMKYEQ
jgi:hypothetical protein